MQFVRLNGVPLYPVETTRWSLVIIAPLPRFIQFDREVISADVKRQRLNLMPGFKFSWYYSGMVVEPEETYYNVGDVGEEYTIAFVRHDS